MAWTSKQIFLAFMMVITGSINTLSTKVADEMEAENSAHKVVPFTHPYFQTEGMFIGEMLCMLTFYIIQCCARRRQQEQVEMAPSRQQVVNFPKQIFFVPAFCDCLATSTMYLGLTLTYASSFQMLRGAVIVFTGLLSVAFLGRKLRYYQWIGIFVVIAGLVIVGVSDFIGSTDAGKYSLNGIITGDLLIITAQIVTATQMVVEEKFVTKHNVPSLLAVGWEGVFGFTIMTILLVPFNWIPAGMFSTNPRGVLEDIPDAFIQLSNNPVIVAPLLGNIISIAFFNFAGISVTKELSATTRMVLDSVRTLVIWIVSLVAGMQKFQYLQPIGFGVLVIGMMLYNDVIILPLLRKYGCVNDALPEDQEPVIASGSSGASSDSLEKKGIDNPNATVEPL